MEAVIGMIHMADVSTSSIFLLFGGNGGIAKSANTDHMCFRPIYENSLTIYFMGVQYARIH